MLAGHARMPHGTNFIYLFHMPLFFIISGYFFKESCYENIKNVIQYIKRKIKHLAIPFIACNGIFLIFHNLFLKINIYTNNPLFMNAACGNHWGIIDIFTLKQFAIRMLGVFLLGYGELLGGATWFIRVLFWISICFCIGSCVIKQIKFIKPEFFELTRFLICLICLMVGFYMQKAEFNWYSIGTMFSCAILFEIGIIYSKYKERIKVNLWGSFISFLMLICLLKCFHCHFEIAANTYNNQLLLIIASVSGFYLTLFCSKCISMTKFSKVFEYIGKNTMIILCLHFFAFKLITYMQIKIYDAPNYMLAAFPVFHNEGMWWVAYIVVGITIPLLLQKGYNFCKQAIIKK